MSNNFELDINAEVIAQMAEMAALETEGVAALGVKSLDIKSFVKNGLGTKAVNVSTDGGIIKLQIFIAVGEGINVNEVAERVQNNVKEKVQGMSGRAVTRVDVIVSDIIFEDKNA